MTTTDGDSGAAPRAPASVSGDHYFSTRPASTAAVRTIGVRLRGRSVPVTTAGGVFSPERVDPGTEVLLREVPAPPAGGDLLDLGCGWGPMAISMAMASPAATVWAVDVNERARDLVSRNAAALGLTGIRVADPADVPGGLRFDAIWSNPPIRVGKDALHAMLLQWLPRLSGGASAWLVVQRNLGADSLHRWLQHVLPEPATVERTASSKGYRLLRVRYH